MKKFFTFMFAMLLVSLSTYADDFKITSSNPAAGECAGIARSSYWTFTTNMDADDTFKAVKYEFYDATTKSSLYSTNVSKSAKYNAVSGYSGVWAIKNFSTAIEDFKKGHKIVLRLIALDNEAPSLAQEIGKDSVVYTGSGSEDYQYSPATVTISPEAGTELKSTDDNTFVLTFSQPVRLNKDNTKMITGQSSTSSFQSITANEDSTVWTLVAKTSTIEAATPQAYINVYGVDMDGKTLEGNTSGAYQLEGKSYYKFKYECYLGSPALVVEPAAGQVTSLKDFKVSYSSGMDLSYAAGIADITVTNEAGDVVATVSTKSADNAITVDSENNLYATFSLPTEITTPGKYTLNIPSKLFALGTDYNGYTSKAQTVAYTVAAEALKVASVDPADNAELAKFPELLTVTFNNPDAVAYANYYLYDNNYTNENDSIVFSAEFTKNSDNTFTSKAGKWVEAKLYTGHTYTLKIKTWGDEMDYNYGNAPSAIFSAATWTGTTVPYNYSEVTLNSTEPADQSTITTGDFTVTFSDAVASVTAKVNGGLSDDTPCEVVAGNDGNKTWKVTIPESIINAAAGSLNVNIVAKDANGLYVKGNSYADPDTTNIITFNCYEGCPAPATITPADGSTLTSISTITLSDTKGIDKAYLATSYITVTNTKTKSIVATVPDENVVVEDVELGETPTSVTITLPQEITTAGTYQVNIPAMYFMIGEGFDSKTTKAMTLTYTIEGEEPVEQPATVKTASSTVVELTFKEWASPSWDGQKATVTTADGTQVTTASCDYGSDNFDYYTCKFTFADELADGNYIINLPAGIVIFGENGDKCDAMSINFTVGGTTPDPTPDPSTGDITFTSDPADGSTVASISKVTFTFTNASTADYGAVSPTITNAAGESVSSVCNLSWGIDLNQVVFDCVPVTAEGTYTITLPAGSVVIDNVTTTKDIVITLTIGNSTAVSNVAASASSNAVRYNLGGQRVNGSAKGIVIMNGKKYTVK